MLAKDPVQRFATPADVAAALTPFARGHRLDTLLAAVTGDTAYADQTAIVVAEDDSASHATMLVTAPDNSPVSGSSFAETQSVIVTPVQKRGLSVRFVIAATALLVSVTLGAIIYRVQTDRGTLLVEVDEDAAAQIETQLKDGSLVFHDKGRGTTWKVKPLEPKVSPSGTYRIEPISGLQLTVSDDTGVVLNTDAFTLKRHGKIVVHVSVAKVGTADEDAVTGFVRPQPVTPGDYALQFDGATGYVDVPTLADLGSREGQALTYEAYVTPGKIGRKDADHRYQGVIMSHGSSSFGLSQNYDYWVTEKCEGPSKFRH